jgi:hypothetical protein
MIAFESPAQRAPGTRRVELPARLATKEALLESLRAALPLPAYFGGNWDALEECLNDPGVLGPALVELAHHDLPLERARERRIYLEILEAAPLTAVFPAQLKPAIAKLLGPA